MTRKPRARRAARAPVTVSVTQARAELCPLVRDIEKLPQEQVAIRVGEEVAAYLVSARKLERLAAAGAPRDDKPRLRGLLPGSGSDAAIAAALKRARAEQDRLTLAEWEETNR